MKPETKDALCDSELLRVREMHFERLEALFAGERLDTAFVLSGLGHFGPAPDSSKGPEECAEEGLDFLAGQAEKAKDEHMFRPLCSENWLYGVHFTDCLFGAAVYMEAGQWWSKGLETPIGELPKPDLETNETWLQAKRVTEAIVAAGCTVPLITMQVLGGPVNQAFNIYKDRLLTAFYENPEGVRRDLQTVSETLRAMHRWYLDTIPPLQMQPIAAGGRCQPRGHGQMCGCATQLVSGDIYGEFLSDAGFNCVLGDYERGGMFHLCGSHTQHIPVWRENPKLRAIQINDRAADDLEIYFRGLREDQIIYFNPTTATTIDRAMEITGGRRLVIVAEVDEPLLCS